MNTGNFSKLLRLIIIAILATLFDSFILMWLWNLASASDLLFGLPTIGYTQALMLHLVGQAITFRANLGKEN